MCGGQLPPSSKQGKTSISEAKPLQLTFSRLTQPKMRSDVNQEKNTQSSTLKGQIRSLLVTDPAHIFALYVSVHLQEQPPASSGELLRDPTLLGILLGSSARCPDRQHPFLCPSLLSTITAPWPSFFSRFLTFDRLVQLLIPRHLGTWPGRWPASPRAEVPSVVTHILGVHKSAPHLFFFCSQRQLLSSFPYHRFREVCREKSASPLASTPCSFLNHQLSPLHSCQS